MFPYRHLRYHMRNLCHLPMERDTLEVEATPEGDAMSDDLTAQIDAALAERAAKIASCLGCGCCNREERVRTDVAAACARAIEAGIQAGADCEAAARLGHGECADPEEAALAALRRTP